jgi:hypothetical protein
MRGEFLESLTLHVSGFKPENTLAIRREQGKDVVQLRLLRNDEFMK